VGTCAPTLYGTVFTDQSHSGARAESGKGQGARRVEGTLSRVHVDFIFIVKLVNLLFAFVLLPDMFILVKIKIFKFTI